MAEKSVALPLSGEEIVEALLYKIRKHLLRDCYLNPNTAYQWFEAEVYVKMRLHDTGRLVEVERNVNVQLGEEPEVSRGTNVVEDETVLNIEQAPPNEVRLATDQAAPVLTLVDGKPEIKRVSYRKPGTILSKEQIAAEKIKENEAKIKQIEQMLQERP